MQLLLPLRERIIKPWPEQQFCMAALATAIGCRDWWQLVSNWPLSQAHRSLHLLLCRIPVARSLFPSPKTKDLGNKLGCQCQMTEATRAAKRTGQQNVNFLLQNKRLRQQTCHHRIRIVNELLPVLQLASERVKRQAMHCSMNFRNFEFAQPARQQQQQQQFR